MIAEFLDRCRELAAEVAPELTIRPFYLCDSTMCRVKLAGFGVAHPTWVNCHLRDQLESVGLYRGPGPQIVLDCLGLVAQGAGGDWTVSATGVFLHELAHVVPPRAVAEVSYRSTPVLAEERRVMETIEEPSDAPPWEPHHDLQFHRVLLHLTYRAGQAGIIVPATSLGAAGEAFEGLSPLAAYWRALSDEPADLAKLPFSQMQELPVPRAFSDLWQSDTDDWMQRRQQQTQQVA